MHPMLATQIPGYFKARRDILMEKYPGAAFIFSSHSESIRNSDVHYPFRQDSNFYYLTGFKEPESYLVLVPTRSEPGTYKLILFVQPRDLEKEMWEGERYGIEGAQRVFGADEAYAISEFQSKLPQLLQGADRIFYRIGLCSKRDQQIFALLDSFRISLARAGKGLPAIEDPSVPMGEMRLIKSPEEIEIMRQGCQISALAHKTVMKEVRPGMNEGEVEALIDYQFRRAGCARLGYSSIVAGGENAACLHYQSNNEGLKDGDLLLIDAGGEYHYYSADITRTFPISREFSQPQSKVYDLVLRAQKEAIGMVRPGVTLPAIHQHVCSVMVEGLLSLGLLQGEMKDVLSDGTYRRYYPHNTSHWLGMDVHDVGLYSQNGEPRPLEAGMVFTIEPGFYVQPNDYETPPEFRCIGIRIEDDILVTAQGYEVMTRDAPKERAEIEALRAYE